MKRILTFFAAIASLVSLPLDAACTCKDCHCTKESQCGCLSASKDLPKQGANSQEKQL